MDDISSANPLGASIWTMIRWTAISPFYGLVCAPLGCALVACDSLLLAMREPLIHPEIVPTIELALGISHSLLAKSSSGFRF